MWPFRKRDGELKVTPTTRRLDDLEDAVEHLNRRFKRLQQQVTRWSEEWDEGDVAEDDEFTALLDEKRRSRG